MGTDRYDSTFLGILQQEGNIGNFLNTVLGFLYRRTDFYHIMKSKEDKIGFPPGVAPRLLIKAYEKYDELSKQRDNSKDTRKVIPSRSEQKDILNKSAAEVTATEKTSSSPQIKQTAAKNTPEDTKKSTTVTESAEAEEDSQKRFQENPESHNGAIRDGYRWAQTLTDCDLRIQVPDYITRAKQVKVTINKKHITVIHTDSDNKQVTSVDSDLVWPINVEESMWSLVPKDCVHINMEKVQERWWEHVFTDEPKINTQKIEATMPMEHLGDEAQSAVDKLMYDDHQKKLGLPTSKEQQMQETLRKAWDADGSPFKGTPFDPSSVNITGNGS